MILEKQLQIPVYNLEKIGRKFFGGVAPSFSAKVNMMRQPCIAQCAPKNGEKSASKNVRLNHYLKG